jgi:uncharacterized RDD family membrane protein YckC
MSDSTFTSASLWRRLAAMVYDSLLIFSILVIVGLTTLPFTNALGVSRDNIFLRLYIFSALFVFLAWFWTHGGQTLGMRAWKLKLVQADGTPVSWILALFYYLVSLPMWGFLIFVIAVNAGMIPAPALLAHTPHWLLYGFALIWFVIDHLPNNWRERIAKLKMILITRQ